MEKKHSALGIASFAASLFAAFGLLAMFIVAGMLSQQGGSRENSPVESFFIAGIAIEAVALALGIAGVFQKNCKRLFAILGIVFSILTLLGILTIIVLVMMITVAISP
jgi:hypothetical protein